MTEYRLAKPEEWEDCIELANYVFSTAHRPHDFEQLIPRVYQAGPEMARIHRVAVAENGRLRAEIAVLPQQMAAGGKLLRAGYVGSVSVHPKARGEGHMKRLLGDWITDLEGTCDLLALDGQRQRYAYFGFTPGSEKYTFTWMWQMCAIPGKTGNSPLTPLRRCFRKTAKRTKRRQPLQRS